MNNTIRLGILSIGVMIFLAIIGYGSASSDNSEISFTGQVTWVDIEGGFYGIITPDGTHYLPLNLPEMYQADGLTILVTGTENSDVVTINMWGNPIDIQSIHPANENNPFLKSWYAPEPASMCPPEKSQAEHLIMAASALQSGLDSINDNVTSIAQNLSTNGIDEENLKSILNEGLDIPGVYEVCYMDETGRLTAIVPEQYEQYEGEDVSGQDLNSRLLSYPAPGMSRYFRTIEGKDAVIVASPVFSADKKRIGYVLALFEPADLTNLYALPSLNNSEYELMVAQPDGTILYDKHPDMNGQTMWNRTLFSEFPDLLSWASHFQNAQAGIDQYSYYREDSEEIAKTDVIWTTVSLHGTPWRVFALHR